MWNDWSFIWSVFPSTRRDSILWFYFCWEICFMLYILSIAGGVILRLCSHGNICSHFESLVTGVDKCLCLIVRLSSPVICFFMFSECWTHLPSVEKYNFKRNTGYVDIVKSKFDCTPNSPIRCSPNKMLNVGSSGKIRCWDTLYWIKI